MNLIFTICSLNYLASAKCLAKSVMQTNPGTRFVYVLADKIDGRLSTDYFEHADYAEVEDLGIPNLEELISTYNIIEFNTAIKPYAIKYLNRRFQADKLIYLDPDIIVFNDLKDVFQNLDVYDFILTPHILFPITKKEFYDQQKGALNTGVFNLGFIAIHYHERSLKIIDWWEYHMRDHGHSNSVIGEFYDQKIMNLLPVFSDKVLIEKNPGYNVAGWNIHEREIKKMDGTYFINGFLLLFYHYSGLVNDLSLNRISNYNQLGLDYNIYISEILELYRKALKDNNHSELSLLPCYYELKPNIHKTTRVGMLKYKLKKYFR